MECCGVEVQLSIRVKWEWLCIAGNVPTVPIAQSSVKLQIVATVFDLLIGAFGLLTIDRDG